MSSASPALPSLEAVFTQSDWRQAQRACLAFVEEAKARLVAAGHEPGEVVRKMLAGGQVLVRVFAAPKPEPLRWASARPAGLREPKRRRRTLA